MDDGYSERAVEQGCVVSRPVRMSLAVAGSDTPEWSEVDVATLADGSLGFVVPDPSWVPPQGAVVLTVDERRVEGILRVVRSGPAYEETRGRLRAGAGRVERWRLRRDRPVALVTVRPERRRP